MTAILIASFSASSESICDEMVKLLCLKKINGEADLLFLAQNLPGAGKSKRKKLCARLPSAEKAIALITASREHVNGNADHMEFEVLKTLDTPLWSAMTPLL